MNDERGIKRAMLEDPKWMIEHAPLELGNSMSRGAIHRGPAVLDQTLARDLQTADFKPRACSTRDGSGFRVIDLFRVDSGLLDSGPLPFLNGLDAGANIIEDQKGSEDYSAENCCTNKATDCT